MRRLFSHLFFFLAVTLWCAVQLEYDCIKMPPSVSIAQNNHIFLVMVITLLLFSFSLHIFGFCIFHFHFNFFFRFLLFLYKIILFISLFLFLSTFLLSLLVFHFTPYILLVIREVHRRILQLDFPQDTRHHMHRDMCVKYICECICVLFLLNKQRINVKMLLHSDIINDVDVQHIRFHSI